MNKLRKLAIVVLITTLVLIVGGFTNLVEFYYFTRPENDPLFHPVVVRSIDDRTIVLADGREIKTYVHHERLRELIDESDSKIDLDVEDSSSPDRVLLFVKRRMFVCGFSPALIRIPIFAREIPANQRWCFGGGTIVISKTNS
jgi:hypothetical protein